MTIRKRDFIRELVRQIPPGEEFTASMIVDMAMKCRADKKYFIVAATVSNVMAGMEDVRPIEKRAKGMVYKRTGEVA